jgi:hypothetical protein
VARYYYFTCGKDKLEVVSWFKYVGITLQTSGTSFTRHIQGRVATAIRAIHDIPHLYLLSIGTVIALFNLKISPAATYGTQLNWQNLTEQNIKKLERMKAMLLKRELCTSKYAPSRLVYTLAGTAFFIKDIEKTYNLPACTLYQRVLQERRKKAVAIPKSFTEQLPC